MWNFKSRYEYGAFSLHDCYVTGVVNNDANIELHFSDGYWISETNRQNLHEKTLRTDASCLMLLNANNEDAFFRGEKLCWNVFCSNINAGQWRFECNVAHYKDDKFVIQGWLSMGDHANQPYPELCLWFAHQGLIYHWNAIREDRAW